MRSFLMLVLAISTSALCVAQQKKQCPPRDNPAASLRLQLAAADVPPSMTVEFTDLTTLRDGICIAGNPAIVGFDVWSGKKPLDSQTVKSTGPEAKSFSKSNGQILYVPSQATIAALEKHKEKGVRVTVWAKSAAGKYIKPALPVDSKSKT